MIITRSPLRISLGGGGTDLPSYSEEHGGFLIAGAIDKYVYITVNRRFVPRILLKYSQLEEIDSVDQIAHPLIREGLRLRNCDPTGLEITSIADIPAGTGLGSSGSFTTAFLRAIHAHQRVPVSTHDLAAEACRIELEILREPVGKQDQFIAAYGGLTCFRFHPGGRVEAWPLKISPETIYDLEDHLLLFFTGYTRSAGAILNDQDSRMKNRDPEMAANLHFVKQLGLQMQEALESGRPRVFGELMHVHWENKKRRSQGMSNDRINAWYDLAMANGALGGKLIGAGGGGFLMFYTEDRARLTHALTQAGLVEMRYRFDFEGTKVLVQ